MTQTQILKNNFSGAKGALMEMYKKQLAQEQKGYYMVASHVYSWLGPANYAAYSYALDVVDELEDKGLLKFSLKRYAKMMREAYEKNWSMAVNEAYKGKDDGVSKLDVSNLWSNLCERVYRRLDSDVTMLYWQVNSLLKKNKAKGDIDLYAKILTAHMMYDMASQRFEIFFKVLGEKYAGGHNFSDRFMYFCPDAQREWMLKIQEALVPKEVVPVFMEDENCKLAFEILNSRLSDTDILDTAASESLDYDPAFKKKAQDIQKKWAAEQHEILELNN